MVGMGEKSGGEKRMNLEEKRRIWEGEEKRGGKKSNVGNKRENWGAERETWGEKEQNRTHERQWGTAASPWRPRDVVGPICPQFGAFHPKISPISPAFHPTAPHCFSNMAAPSGTTNPISLRARERKRRRAHARSRKEEAGLPPLFLRPSLSAGSRFLRLLKGARRPVGSHWRSGGAERGGGGRSVGSAMGGAERGGGRQRGVRLLAQCAALPEPPGAALRERGRREAGLR